MPTLKFNQFLELKNTKNESIQEENIQIEPDNENDAFITANGSDYDVSCFGKFIKTVDEVSDGLELIKLELKKSPNFFPNIWFVSDHGNIDPIDLEGNIIKESIEFSKDFLLNESKGIENKERLTKKVIDVLNEQIKNELVSSQIYRAMSCWLDNKGWINASKYYFKSAKEELTHMDKIYEYIFDKNCKAEVPKLEKVEDEFNDIREIVEKSLEHEIEVTEMWENIANLAKEEGDNTTYEFSQWFIKEQKEEEEKFRNMLFMMNLDMPKWKIEELF